jgi:YVTN family beta-propeller protein
MFRSVSTPALAAAFALLAALLAPVSIAAAEPSPVIVSSIPIPPGGGTVAAGLGSLWIGGYADGTVARVDPATESVTGLVQLPAPTFLVAAGEGAVWATDPDADVVRRIDPVTLQVVATIHVGDLPDWITTGFGSVWVSNHHDNSVSRIDPATNRVVAVVRTGGSGVFIGGPNAITAGAGSIWVGLPKAHQIARIDPALNAVKATAGGVEPCAQMTVAAGYAWAANGFCNRPSRGLARVATDTNRLTTIDAFPNPILGLAPAPGGVWYATFGEIGRVDAVSGTITARMPYDGFVSPLATGFGSVWFVDGQHDLLVRLEP